MTGQLLERWVEHTGWEDRSPGQSDATLARIRKHITPHIGDVALDRLRPVDVGHLYGLWRAGEMAESTVRRMHAVPHVGAATEPAVGGMLLDLTLQGLLGAEQDRLQREAQQRPDPVGHPAPSTD